MLDPLEQPGKPGRYAIMKKIRIGKFFKDFKPLLSNKSHLCLART
jgi:hypothetical protein